MKSVSSISSALEETHTAIVLTSVSQTAPEHALSAGLDKTQQAYNDRFSCPIPPQENRLKVRIEAGEKKFKGDHE
ncbi:MAG TPA: DUF1684 domain-containing protein [Anaerolineae bacterium]